MEIEKTLSVAAPPQRVWELLLDPQVMGGCVPGMKSIEVISPTEYVALMHVKISFISAKFKLRTHIVEQRAPEYLRAEGTGEDASVASSLKQRSEIFLAPAADGGTDLRLKVQVDVLGRLGTFGLGVMKTKADRMWDEFGANLRARIDGGAAPAAAAAPQAPVAPSAAAPADPPAASPVRPSTSPPRADAPVAPPATAPTPTVAIDAIDAPAEEAAGWWSRLLGGRTGVRTVQPGAARCIRVEVRDHQRTVTVEWPVEDAEQCRTWLREVMGAR
ncbi:SRPBCC family protein [Variovorax sp.]|uniref:CoxG family protein n=1 Tax=Variovorax sp. TaxID=1871043 RepID=UPI002D67D220|nr:SRPBCC family protein [Variovorax sp.]HYP83731.1 SRPBCC family protein [Variovorax sp.]